MCLFSAASISTGQILGWGSKTIEILSADTGHPDGVFMHTKDQKLKFLCERNYKVGHLSCLTFAFCVVGILHICPRWCFLLSDICLLYNSKLFCYTWLVKCVVDLIYGFHIGFLLNNSFS